MKTMMMKQLFLITACLVATLMFAASCGGNANKKQSADTATEAAQVETKAPVRVGTMVSQTSKPEDYTAGALAKMASLGKTEKDKRLVTVGGNSDQTVYNVRTFENGKCTDNSEYTFCVAKISQGLFNVKKESAKEVNEADKWVHHSHGDDTGDWQSWYDAAKKVEKLGNRILE